MTVGAAFPESANATPHKAISAAIELSSAHQRLTVICAMIWCTVLWCSGESVCHIRACVVPALRRFSYPFALV
jgi:hypothetical protein